MWLCACLMLIQFRCEWLVTTANSISTSFIMIASTLMRSSSYVSQTSDCVRATSGSFSSPCLARMRLILWVCVLCRVLFLVFLLFFHHPPRSFSFALFPYLSLLFFLAFSLSPSGLPSTILVWKSSLLNFYEYTVVRTTQRYTSDGKKNQVCVNTTTNSSCRWLVFSAISKISALTKT